MIDLQKGIDNVKIREKHENQDKKN